MKLTKIALAVAGLVAASQAFAVPVTPAQIWNARAQNNPATFQQAWISGASAPTKTVYEGWAAGCDATTNAIFTNQALTNTNVTPGSLGNFTAYACTRGGVVSVLYHTLDGGSLNAFTPHTVGTKLARVKFVGDNPATAATAENGCTGTLTYTDATNPQNSATVYKGCTLVGTALPANAIATPAGNTANAAALAADSLAPANPVGGFSDVEGSLFPAAIGGGDVSAVGTDSAVGVGQVFGVVVSRPLYRAMQVKQGIAANTDALDPNFDPANAPSISKAQYASLIAQGGTFTNWTPLVGATAAAGKKVVIARRVQTSGSQASSNAFFLNNPCGSAVGANLNPAAAGDSTPTFEVFEGSGTGNVKTRITTASTAAVDNFAIGVISAENDWRVESPTGGQNGYRFIKVEGVHPEAGDTTNARVTATNAQYPFHIEVHSYTANSAPAGTFAGDIIGNISAALVGTTNCAQLPRGLTLSPLSGSSCTSGAQVAKMTNLGNNCAPVLLTE